MHELVFPARAALVRVALQIHPDRLSPCCSRRPVGRDGASHRDAATHSFYATVPALQLRVRELGPLSNAIVDLAAAF